MRLRPPTPIHPSICPCAGSIEDECCDSVSSCNKPFTQRQQLLKTYSLTTLMPSERAEPTMHLTTFSMDQPLTLKHSSWAFTWAISYTARTDTIPAISWPSHTKDVSERMKRD